MRVPLLDLAAHHAPLRAELDRAIARVIDSGRFIMGAEVESFEKELASATGAGFAIGMSSGTDALLACLMALGVKSGDEVITTPYTFFATAGVIARLGATPVFVDIDPDTFTFDPKRLDAAISPRTSLAWLQVVVSPVTSTTGTPWLPQTAALSAVSPKSLPPTA